MKEKNGKYYFWQTPSLFAVIIFVEIIITVFFTVTLIGDTISDSDLSIFLIIFASLFVLFLLLGLRFFFLRVIIDKENITLMGIFGKITQCKISEIEEVYIKDKGREGIFIIIRDGREKSPHSYSQKNGYVQFQYNAERERLIKMFWNGNIEKYSWDNHSK